MKHQPTDVHLPKWSAIRSGADVLISIPTRVALLIVRMYQLVFSPLKQIFFGPACGCRFQPTCSHYAYEAFRQFGFWKGLWFTLLRILRCHPWHPGGLDPLPDLKGSAREAMSFRIK